MGGEYAGSDTGDLSGQTDHAHPAALRPVAAPFGTAARRTLALAGAVLACAAAAQDPPPAAADERAALQAIWPGALGLPASAEWYRSLKRRHSSEELLTRPDLQRLLQDWRYKRDEQLADALAQWRRDLQAAPNAVAVDTVLARALRLPGDRESAAGQALGRAAQERLRQLESATATNAAPAAQVTDEIPAPTTGTVAAPSALPTVPPAAAASPPSVDSVVAALAAPPRGLKVTPRTTPAARPDARPGPSVAAPVVVWSAGLPPAAAAVASSTTDEPDEADLRAALQAHLDGLSREVDRHRQACWQGRSRSDPGAWLLCEGSTDPTVATIGAPLRVNRFAKLGCRDAQPQPGWLCSYAIQVSGAVPPAAAPLLSPVTGRDGATEARFERAAGRWAARFDTSS